MVSLSDIGNLFKTQVKVPGAHSGAAQGFDAFSNGTGNSPVSWNPASTKGVFDVLGGAIDTGTHVDQSNGGGGGVSAPSAPRPVLNRAAVDNTQRTIDEIPGLISAALDAEGQRYNNAEGQYAAQQKQQQGTYDASTVTNTKNYDANTMDSVRAGIRGLANLLSILRGTGAGGGTAEDLVRDTVGDTTASDIRTGADTQSENQTSLDSTLGSFLTDLQRKRQEAKDARENNERAVRAQYNGQLQDLYGKMAGYYSDAEDTGNATSWLNRAGDLTPSIARDSKAQVSSYDTAPIAVKAPELSAFSGSAQPDITAAPNSDQLGSGIFTISDKRRNRELAPAGV